MVSMKEKITCEHLILCEGEDEKQFLIAYLNSTERKKDDPRFESSVQVWNFGGNEQLKNGLTVISNTEGFSNLKTILIMRGAEADVFKAEKQIKAALSANALPVPLEQGVWSEIGVPFTAYLLFPSLGKGNKNGTLEHLCMELIKDEFAPELILPKISEFMSGLEKDHLRQFKHNFKSKIHSFISMTDPFVGLKIGEAARAGAFDWNNPALTGLNSCLIEGFNKER